MAWPWIYGAIVNVAAVAGCVYLIMHGHWTLGLVVLVFGSHSISTSRGGAKSEN